MFKFGCFFRMLKNKDNLKNGESRNKDKLENEDDLNKNKATSQMI